jgi:putative transposase
VRKDTYKYRHYNHSLGLAVVHLVWIPKRRKPVLVDAVRDRLFQVLNEVAADHLWNIRALEIAPDHIHLFVEIHPTDAINQVVKAFKGRSAFVLRKEFPALTKLPSLWTNSYFFSTAGCVSVDTIERYINDPHHRL